MIVITGSNETYAGQDDRYDRSWTEWEGQGIL